MRQIAGAALLAATFGLLVSGCGADDSPKEAPSATSTASLTTDAPTSAPTASVSTTPTAPAKVALADRVLAAEDLPAALSGSRKKLPPTAVVGTCNRVPLRTIGATRTAAVSYTAADHGVISEVARVADEKSASLILKTLRSLHDKCTAKTTAIVPVPVPGASSAWRYTATTSDGLEGFGIALVGRTMAVVSLRADAPTVESHLDDLVATAAGRVG